MNGRVHGFDRQGMRHPPRNVSLHTALLAALLLLALPLHGAAQPTPQEEPLLRPRSSFSISLPDHTGRTDDRTVEPASSAARSEAEAVAARVSQALQDIRDVQQYLRMAIINPQSGTVTHAEGQLRGRMPDLFRVDFTAPDMLAGVTVIIDLSKNEVRQFQPVTEQVIVQPWDKLASERGIEFDVQGWLGVPDPDKFSLTRLEDALVDETRYVVLQGVPRDVDRGSRYEFFINPERWWVEGLRVYDGHDNLIFSATMEDVTFNQDLDEQQLRSLPAGAEVIHR